LFDEAAFRTLWIALVQAVRVVAPVLPFLSEHLWQTLVTGACPDAPASVHLAGWPVRSERPGDDELLAEIAARTAGTTAPTSQMLPLALLVMLVMVLPSVGGWGPREGATAWVFSSAGLGAEQGVATAVVYGVMVFVASLPGAAVLVVSWSRRIRPPERTEPRLPEEAAHA
jgi:hypothetical protein